MTPQPAPGTRAVATLRKIGEDVLRVGEDATELMSQTASVYEIPLIALSGESLDPALLRGRASLIVNVASRCGLTPQYESLQRLYERYRDRGLIVLGTPCDQFAGQEPGSAEEITAFCSTTYSVTFPLTEKLEVNGAKRHPLYAILTAQKDRAARAGDVEWNFEKFVVSPSGRPIARFRPTTLPEDEALVATLEAILPGVATPQWATVSVDELTPGDRVRLPTGAELTVSRIEGRFLDREGVLCLIEDSPSRWLAQPIRAGSQVEVLSQR